MNDQDLLSLRRKISRWYRISDTYLVFMDWIRIIDDVYINEISMMMKMYLHRNVIYFYVIVFFFNIFFRLPVQASKLRIRKTLTVRCGDLKIAKRCISINKFSSKIIPLYAWQPLLESNQNKNILLGKIATRFFTFQKYFSKNQNTTRRK